MSNLEVPDDGFFNDLSVQPPDETHLSGDSPDHVKAGEAASKPKRIACLICRKRKLRCDGIRPSCGNCTRLGHECGYSDVRRKSGPRRGYVKELEARLHQVEHQLRNKDDPVKKQSGARSRSDGIATDVGASGGGAQNITSESMNDALPNGLDGLLTDGTYHNAQNITTNVEMPWTVMTMGLEEPLPPQEMIDEMEQIYFDTIHKSLPMIHKYRFLAALNLAPISRPPICLRYSMWTYVASITERYSGYVDIFYRRSRKYVELDEMKGHGECFVTVGHAQCWALISSFEFKMMYFPRAWMSVGRCSRLVQMLGLQRVDHDGLEVKKTLAPPRDWVDREERRRTFWMAYCNDRYASIGTGWPMTFDEKDIFTDLPASLEAFEKGTFEKSVSFSDALTGDGASRLSALGAVALVASIFGQNLTHLHRSYDNDDPDDPTNGGFWKRHRQLDNLLSTITLFLPERLKIPSRDQDPNIAFLNMALHTAVICLHQAAILKAEKHQLDNALIKQSVTRCFHAAEEVFNVMQMTSHIGMGRLHPFMAFCLYVAARVMIHAYRKRPDAVDVRDKFEFLMKAMQAHMKKTPLTASFLAQLQVELEAAGLDNPLGNISLQNPDKFLGDDYLPPVVPRLSQTQPSFHELRAEQATTSSYIQPETAPDQACTVFDLPPRLKGRVTSMPQESASGGNIIINAENYQVFDAEMTPGDQSGFTGHPTPSSGLHGSSNTSYSPGAMGGVGGSGGGNQDKTAQQQQQQQQQQQPTEQPLADAQAFFAQSGYSNFAAPVDSAFGNVNDWTLVDPTLNASIDDSSWAQYDPMAWDAAATAAAQGMNLQSMQDLSSTPSDWPESERLE